MVSPSESLDDIDPSPELKALKDWFYEALLEKEKRILELEKESRLMMESALKESKRRVELEEELSQLKKKQQQGL